MVEAAAAEEALARAWVRGDQPLNTVDDARSFSANTAAARWLPPTSLSRQLTVCHSSVSQCVCHTLALAGHERAAPRSSDAHPPRFAARPRIE